MLEGLFDLYQVILGGVYFFVFFVVDIVVIACQTLLPALPGGLWCAWWLWCVNWKKAWPMLAQGGWVGVALLTFVSALSWAQIFPARCTCLGFPIANFWWQLGACSALVLVALFCGWVQEKMNWTPEEVSFDPPEETHHGHGHGHGHAHGHHH